MTTANATTPALTHRQRAFVSILANYAAFNEASLERLIELTNGISGVSFVSIKGYNSDKSEHTEIANHVINIGVNYQNMVNKDQVSYENVDLDSIDVDGFDYSHINTGTLTLDQFKVAVRNALPVALVELQEPRERGENSGRDLSADIYLNKALVYNMNTNRLSIIGQSINKTVVSRGVPKLVKSAPKTVAKNIIKDHVSSKTEKMRRFTLDNCLATINLMGDTLEVL
jgi:hypothetical protein